MSMLPLPERIETVALIGAGTAGRSFAAICLRAGLHVVLEDVMPVNLRRAQEVLIAGLGRLTLAATVEDAVRDADLALDFVPDELESKLEIFSMIDRMAPPRTILCTPTEALSMTDLASCIYRPDRCFGLAGAGPDLGHAIDGRVDLMCPPASSAEALVLVREFLCRLGFVPEAKPDTGIPMLVKNLT